MPMLAICVAQVLALDVDAGADVDVAVGIDEVVDAFEMSCDSQCDSLDLQRTEVAREHPFEAVAVMTLSTDEQAASLRPIAI